MICTIYLDLIKQCYLMNRNVCIYSTTNIIVPKKNPQNHTDKHKVMFMKFR